jgi:hypothetical protein
MYATGTPQGHTVNEGLISLRGPASLCRSECRYGAPVNNVNSPVAATHKHHSDEMAADMQRSARIFFIYPQQPGGAHI